MFRVAALIILLSSSNSFASCADSMLGRAAQELKLIWSEIRSDFLEAFDQEIVRFSDNRSPRGLKLENGVVSGEPTGALTARVIYWASVKHGIRFLIKDDEFKLRLSRTDTLASGNTVFLRSRFMQRPNFWSIIHEIGHTTSVRKKQLARLILFERSPYGLAATYNPYGHVLRYRFDELERYVSVHRGEAIALPRAAQFYRHQSELVSRGLAELTRFNTPIRRVKVEGVERPGLDLFKREGASV